MCYWFESVCVRGGEKGCKFILYFDKKIKCVGLICLKFVFFYVNLKIIKWNLFDLKRSSYFFMMLFVC